ncbi:DUF3080 domain-containing protein [Alteromonas ponticola]|uniref:DUF3080 domain-containing protein n=1 Tax=Alteromonas aquimaris TaxID=2998417 RepID=A0ABT3P7P8_9ALTE|nr:DUF3080 family protein [Alteromonas aquimaris]MCW8108787.1 DUF3080 domain-containing protein [Alteromonas aquimaris]
MSLLSCSYQPTLETTLDDYQQRLQRVLNIEVVTPVRSPELHLPDLPDNPEAIQQLNINLIDFNRLNECEVSSLIAERNTTLGKVQPLSQRFIYEAKLLTLLERCELSLALTDAGLSKRVGEIFRIKQAQFSALWALLIQKSDEMKVALSVSNASLVTRSTHSEMNSVVALSYLDSLKDKPLEVVNKEVEASLATLYLSRLPAKLWRTQMVLTRQLTNITQLVSTELEELDCSKTTDFSKAEILRNVFQLFFIQQIQPIGSELNHYQYQLLPIWERWITDKHLSPPFKQYLRKHTQDGFSHYKTAMHEHVLMWQNFFKQCGMEVSANR